MVGGRAGDSEGVEGRQAGGRRRREGDCHSHQLVDGSNIVLAGPDVPPDKLPPVGASLVSSRSHAFSHFTVHPHVCIHVRYMPFHVLQFFETTLATITSVLCNQALLTSVGVSAEGSIFGAVAVQWIIKDGAGEVAKLFFIRRFSPYFDSHPKTVTLLGEALGCLGSGLQIATVLVAPTPSNFLLCAGRCQCLAKTQRMLIPSCSWREHLQAGWRRGESTIAGL